MCYAEVTRSQRSPGFGSSVDRVLARARTRSEGLRFCAASVMDAFAVIGGHPRPLHRAGRHYAGAELLAQGDAGGALHQLAAGPVRQLPGALRVPGAGRRAADRGRPRRRHGGHQPVRLLRRASAEQLPVRLSGRSCGRSSRPTSKREPAGPRLAAFLDERPARGVEHGRLPRRPQPAAAAARSATSSAWSRACRRRRRRCEPAPARAATPPGCWCRSCATSASRRASSRAT